MTDLISRTPGAATQPVIFFQAVADHFSSITPNRKIIMNAPLRFKRTRIAALMAVALFSTGAWAQDRAPAPIDVPFQAAEPAPGARGGLVQLPIDGGEMKGAKVLRLACCHCLGEISKLDLTTGVAPWTVKGPTGPGMAAVVVNSPHPLWDNTPPAKWINDNGTLNSAAGFWKFRLRVLVPKCVIPFQRPLKLTGSFSGDDAIKMFVNGNLVPGTSIGQGVGWTFKNMHPFSTTLSPGMNLIEVEVENAGGPMGMKLHALLDAPCVKENADQGGGHLPVEPLN